MEQFFHVLWMTLMDPRLHSMVAILVGMWAFIRAVIYVGTVGEDKYQKSLMRSKPYVININGHKKMLSILE